jgi:hypothetical protein
LGLAFFGLTSDIAQQVRFNLFKQIHEIVFHGKGGYDWHTIYNMPIWLRKFTFHQLQTFYDEEKQTYEESQNAGQTTAIDSSGKVHTPEFMKPRESKSPTYTTRASNK